MTADERMTCCHVSFRFRAPVNFSGHAWCCHGTHTWADISHYAAAVPLYLIPPPTVEKQGLLLKSPADRARRQTEPEHCCAKNNVVFQTKLIQYSAAVSATPLQLTDHWVICEQCVRKNLCSKILVVLDCCCCVCPLSLLRFSVFCYFRRV